MDLERRGHLGVSRVLSNGPDIRPDPNLSRNMSNEFVRVEDFQKWMKANDTVLRARTHKSFIAGALFAIFVLVSITMAGVSLGKIAKNAKNLDDHEVQKVNLEDLEQRLKAKVLKVDDHEKRLGGTKLEIDDLNKKLEEIRNAYKSYEQSCTSEASCPRGKGTITG